ncbi:MAG: trehalase family glycosidase [Bacteroidetes bacterium]|nr:trehalase family glycosidase [Bacteroidota bacterium]
MRKFLFLFLLITCYRGSGQFLSNLHATRSDALFTTYAAPLARSTYKLDQGYQFLFNDAESGVEMISSDGPNFGLASSIGNETRFRLKELFMEPVITTSYSDILKYYYYAFKDIRVDVSFDVFSSGSAFIDYVVCNSGKFVSQITLIPYHYYPSADSIVNLQHDNLSDGYYYPLYKKPDSWMKEHQIPIITSLRAYLLPGLKLDSMIVLSFNAGTKTPRPAGPLDDIRRSIQLKKMSSPGTMAVFGMRTIRLEPGESTRFRIVFGLEDVNVRMQDAFRKLKPLMDVDPANIVREDEKVYSKILQVKLPGRDNEMLYWSCFSLMRQCMMPSEGKCRTNYYVFSREPKWGWGYGGQVFHESLSMLAYVYMDPVSAMNSQRVFIHRQQPDGYINYRTGPYLDETIPYANQLTTSAPWFNYINWEVYKISKDRKFLQEAYISGKKFYTFFVKNRDSNLNGLCEWGAEGELESVRDARVAVWDKVGRPMSFEGPDVNSMLVMEARSLSEMAKTLGLAADARQWEDLAKQRSALINHFMWDTTTGFYYNINKLDQGFTFRNANDLKIKEIIGFLPLWAGVCNTKNAGQLMRSLRDPKEFHRLYGIPTLTARSDYYNPIGYWNGPVWVQWEYLIYRGLRDYGYNQDASELVNRVLDNMIWHLKQDHVFWEFYSADEHQAGWNKTYIWAGIAARMLIDEYSVK